MVRVYLGLGSNLGRRRQMIRKAIQKIGENGSIKILRASFLYETQPWGRISQKDFINAVVCASTSLAPLSLLKRCQEIERKLGRRRRVRFGPREIDIDILVYGKRSLKLRRLILPHPRIPERRFVLEPLAEIAPRLRLPGLNKTIRALLKKTPDKSRVQRIP